MSKLSLFLGRASVALAVLAVMFSCGPAETPVPSEPKSEVTGVKFDKSEITIAIGESVNLNFTVTPSGASASNTSWSSSDASIASVSGGVVSGVKEGTVSITINVGGKTAACTVKVVKGGFPEGQVPPDNEIWYTTSDNKPLEVFSMQGNSIVQSHKYSGGMGVLHFHAPVTEFHQLAESKEDCNRVTGILLPDCVESFDQFAFYYGYNLKEFRVPAALKSTGGVPFNHKSGSRLERFTGNHISEDGRCVVINGTMVGFAPAGIETYEIPSGVVNVGTGAFANVKTLKSLVIPSGVKVLEMDSISNCGLEEITIPASVTGIDSYAFHYCENLKRLLGDSPFISSDRKYLYDPRPDAYYPMTLFFFAGKDDSSYEIPEGIRYIENYAFSNCVYLKSITFPQSLEVISEVAFEGCKNLETLNGSHISSDHKGFVNDAGSLQFLVPGIDDDYVVPDEVTGIGAMLFADRSTLHSVSMGDNVTSLGNYAFYHCESLKTVTLSANLASVGYNPFMHDKGLEAVYFRGILPPSYSDYQFTEAPSLKFYVPSQSISAYKSSIGWKDYWTIMQPYDYTDLPEIDFYMSSDYSKDGEVTVYQKASEGNGIDIVFMGDAYSDRQVASGLYIHDMKACAEEFFAVEPYKSFRQLFNIYFVTTISATEGYTRGGQSLGTVLHSGTAITGNDAKCFELALKAVQDQSRMDDVLVVVCGYQDLSGLIQMRGTCSMSDPVKWDDRDYACGPSVAYFLKLDESLQNTGPVIRHEAGGHGFAKLGDEYNYSGSIATYDYERIKTRSPYGWYANVDLTSDPALIKWSVFLSDERYKYDGVGIFEGGFTYAYGVWRPSENSIMKNNSYGIFNAPSRYAIWYRIHKLAYGKSWKGTYEDFVAYDAINRKTAPASIQHAPGRRTAGQHETTSAPVVTGRTWREIMEQ